MKKGNTLHKMQVLQSIFEILAYAKQYISVKDITTKINNKFSHQEMETNKANIKRCLQDMQTYMGYKLDKRKGKDGGYKLHQDDWKELSKISNQQLSHEEKNALNDAFEISAKSSTFFYTQDLEKAVGKLYLKMSLKDQDFEYYVGKTHKDAKHTKLVKDLKFAAVNHHYLDLSLKYEYYNIPKTMSDVRPIYIIHDNDESFIIIKHKGKNHYLNILNIKTYQIKEATFVLPYPESIDNFKNNYTIKAKTPTKLSFTITSERGLSTFYLWNYQMEDLTPNKEFKKTVIFYEEYKLYMFLTRMHEHIKDLKILTNKEKVEKWTIF